MQSSVPEPAPVLSAYLRGAWSINRLPADFVWKFCVHRALLNPPCMCVCVCTYVSKPEIIFHLQQISWSSLRPLIVPASLPDFSHVTLRTRDGVEWKIRRLDDRNRRRSLIGDRER